MNLIINRGETVAFSQLPPKSIALDGYCQGPALDLDNERLSLDHHDGCLRLVTSATCKQVLDVLLLGLDPNGFNVYVNDVDGDTALSVWLLQNPMRVTEFRVRQLVEVVAAMDAHGPAYPTVDEALCSGFYDRAMAAERDARRQKTYGTADLGALLSDCLRGITALIDNHAGKIEVQPPDTRSFEVTRHGEGWVMATSDSFVFDLLYKAGHTAAVAYRGLPDGSFEYTIGKKSDLVRFPLGPHSKPGTILHALAAIEPGWGGGSTIGGAPRNPDGSRSKLTPAEVFELITKLLQ